MKILFYIAIATLMFLGSCGANEEAVYKMADEMCGAMELITDDPMSMLDAVTKISEIASNSDEYASVTQTQLIAAMEERCPEGAAKFKDLTE